MSRILFITANVEISELARNTLATAHPDIWLESKSLYEALDTAHTYIPKGLEIAIARGRTAIILREGLPQIAVVEVPVTSEDFADAIHKASQYGTKIAIIAYPYMMKVIKPLIPFFNHQFILTETPNASDVKPAILNAFSQGADVVVGGGVMNNIAKAKKLPAVLVGIGKTGILQAVEQAKTIQKALFREKLRLGEFATIMDYSTEGIIIVSNQFTITGFNPMASKLTGIQHHEAMGQDITRILPEINIEKTFAKRKEARHSLVFLNNVHTICNIVSICIENRSMGIVITLQKVSQVQQIEARIRREIYSKGHIATFTFNDILGKGATIRQCVSVARQYAQTLSNILIVGESGTGKELFAQSIHNAGIRPQGPFVAINCAALPQNILESELFGYVSGAFTGAGKEGKPGLFELGHNGTVFMDEIAELSFENQGRLLRVLQEKTIMRLGSDRVIPIDVQIIAATNKDLKKMVEEGKFRDDLYYRLNVLRLSLPPLRERTEDIEICARYFLGYYAKRLNKSLELSHSAIKWLKCYNWPGNIRELSNIMERVAAILPSGVINANVIEKFGKDDYGYQVNDKQYKTITNALQQTNGNIKKAADILGIHRSTLWRQMKKYDL